MLLATIIAGVISALATGLGVLPFMFFCNMTVTWKGIASAVAGGMMLGASVFSLADEGLKVGTPWEIVAGLMGGTLFFWYTSRLLEKRQTDTRYKSQGLSVRSLLIIITMFIHSAAEGVAIGVGFGSGEYELGLLLALVISVHNIPEGIAITIPLRAQGVSLWRCAGYAIFTSVPQPIMAVPAYLLVHEFSHLLAVCLGFAGGAMIYLVAAELLPDSLKHCTRHQTAWGVMVGLSAMLLFVALVGP